MNHHPPGEPGLSILCFVLLLMCLPTATLGQDLAEVQVMVRSDHSPVESATVTLDLNANWQESGQADAADEVAFTNASGTALFTDIVSLEHAEAEASGPWSPTRLHLARIHATASSSNIHLVFGAPDDPRPIEIDCYDLRGRRVGRQMTSALPQAGQAVEFGLELESHGYLPAGVYLLAVTLGDEIRSIKVTRLARDFGRIVLERATVARARELGWDLDEIRSKDASSRQAINIVVEQDDFPVHIEAVDLVPGLNQFEVDLAPAVGSVLVHGRTGDELGDLMPGGGQWSFINSASGDVYTADLDASGYWSVTLPDSIPSQREMWIQFGGNADYRPGTFTFLKSDSCSAVGVEFTSVDVHPGQESFGRATFEALDYSAGHVALAFSEASAANDTIMDMIRNPWTNDGVWKWVHPTRNLYSRTDRRPSGEEISEERRALQLAALEFVRTHAMRLPGDIDLPYVDDILDPVEAPGYPDDPLGWVVIYEYAWDGPPGNHRGPPGSPGTMTYAVGHTEGLWFNTMVSELMEALGLNDYVTGTNSHGFDFSPDGELILSRVGRIVLAVANTYAPYDFKIP